jgi:hypothetical protein
VAIGGELKMRLPITLSLLAAAHILAACGESEHAALARRANQERENCVARYLSAARDGRLGPSGQATSENVSRWNELCRCAADRLATRATSEYGINENSMNAAQQECIRSGQ